MPTRDPDPRSERPVHDLVGVGFGPSNLALAAAIEEHAAHHPDEALTARFLERQPTFGWHTGMLLDGATMQVSFLKDLVTMRDPTSPFSFLRYLDEHDRLADFINHKLLYPSRVEYADYLGWVARQLDHLAVYSAEVVEVRPVTGDDGSIDLLDVVVQRSAPGQEADRETYRTRNLVVATGLTPTLPAGVEAGPRTWHSADLLRRLPALETDVAAGAAPPVSFVVLGRGQSAAEVTEHLHTRFPDAQVQAVFGSYGYSPADDSPFVNQIFDPDAVDHHYDAPPEVRAKLLADHRSTNYSVVDLDLIEELYRRQYHEKVVGGQRLHTHRSTIVTDLVTDDDGVDVHVCALLTGERRVLRADVVVCATGYRCGDARTLLGEVAGRCADDDDGHLALRRDYRVVTDDALRAGIYVQGATEHSHGIGSTLLSNTAVRAGEILASLLDAPAAEVPRPNPIPSPQKAET
jgi:L-ornithine N5-oxygenase